MLIYEIKAADKRPMSKERSVGPRCKGTVQVALGPWAGKTNTSLSECRAKAKPCLWEVLAVIAVKADPEEGISPTASQWTGS